MVMWPFARKWMLPAKATRSKKPKSNLAEAVSLFLETADPSEIERRGHSEVFVTRLEVSVG